MSGVRELPVGKYDAVRTLRHLLSQAEAGEFNRVIVICNDHPEDSSGWDVWVSWSDMEVQHVWWLAGWLVAFLQCRFFGGTGLTKD